MKILVITQYYYPEPGATTNRLKSLVEAMSRRGHDVTVICEFPNHPSGILDRKDRWKLFRSERFETYRIIRTFVLTFARKNNMKRLFFYLSFSVSAFLAAIFLKRHDVIFSSSPPIFHVFTAMIAAKIKGSNFVVDIRDIWPDTALEFKAVKSGRLLKWGGFLEKKLYANARLISTISEGLKNTIDRRGGEGKTSIIYNGSGYDMLNWRGDKSAFRESQGFSGKIIVCYAGLIGLGQNMVDLLPEFELLLDSEVKFLIIGDGPGKAELVTLAANKGLGNIEFRDMMPRGEVIPFIHSSDIMMVILRESDFFKSAIPSKVFDYMAAGKPIVTNVDGELREIITAHAAGVYFSLRDRGSFGRAIERLKADPELRYTMGRNGRGLVERNFLRPKLAERLVENIESHLE